jgi:hypothetical protein
MNAVTQITAFFLGWLVVKDERPTRDEIAGSKKLVSKEIVSTFP